MDNLTFNCFKYSCLAYGIVFLILFHTRTFGEKILVYDEERGIIFIDKDSIEDTSFKNKIKSVPKSTHSSTNPSQLSKPLVQNSNTIHRGREKDPPELYFQSGIEYYKNSDFDNALKNFSYAFKKDIKPEYLLWMGKTYRQLKKIDTMLVIMKNIVKDYPESDVADDALFEMAFVYQQNNDYERAIKTYKDVVEQYPFGVSYSNEMKFIEIAQKQIRLMRGEIISAITMLGIHEESLPEAYTKFQKKYNLAVNGKGDSETIRAIKDATRKRLDEDEKKSGFLQQFKHERTIMFSTSILLFVCFIINIIIRLQIFRNREQLQLIQGLFSDLN